MASIDTQARSDIRDKMIFERELFNTLRKFDTKTVKDFIRTFGMDSRILQVDKSEMNEVLSKHYEKVGADFSDRINKQLPQDIKANDDEIAETAAALALIFSQATQEAAELITNTTQRDITESIDTATQTSEPDTSRVEIAVLAGAVLSRRLNGRRPTIAETETQSPAETAKGIEARVLSGAPIDDTGVPSPVRKVWTTEGDEVVRPAHVIADSQERPLNEPFDVGGERLRWPKDTLLGATAGNVINCRCSSNTVTDDLIAVRRGQT